MTTEFGQELKSVRLVKGMSLREVARPAEISVAYLQKLESGDVRQPSPNVLFRLSNVLDVPYETLMDLAGYETVSTQQADLLGARSRTKAFTSAIDNADLTNEERRAVVAFIAHLRQQRTKGST